MAHRWGRLVRAAAFKATRPPKEEVLMLGRISHRIAHHASPLACAALAASLSACAAHDGAGDETASSGGVSEVASAITTTTLLATTSIAKGASKTGVYTATVAGKITFRTSGTG